MSRLSKHTSTQESEQASNAPNSRSDWRWQNYTSDNACETDPAKEDWSHAHSWHHTPFYVRVIFLVIEAAGSMVARLGSQQPKKKTTALRPQRKPADPASRLACCHK